MTIHRPKIAEVFQPLWMPEAAQYRYLGAHGGRGSGKSWDRALAAVVKMTSEEARIACVREVQKSLKDSVHQLLVDTIQRENLGPQFEITERAIRNIVTGGFAVFMGMKDQNAESVKSLEGFDVAWWEEAQTAASRSLELLRPTIRKPGSQIWATWNPRYKHDPIDRLLRQGNLQEGEALVIKANWDANPWWTDELERERQMDLRDNPERYLHIWEGAYETESDTQFISGGLVQAAMTREVYTDLSHPCIIGVDVARFGDDRTVIYPRRGPDARSMPYVTLKGADTMQVVGRALELAQEHKADAIFVDEGGVGAGVIDRLHQLTDIAIGINFGASPDNMPYGMPRVANKRAEIWAKMRESLRLNLAIPEDEDLEQDLTGPLYSFNADNAIQLEKKADMKKRGIRSSDIADALALTYALPVQPRAIIRAEEQRAEDEYDPIHSYQL